tara:strand:+ start:101 stop:274 length:174 start_codon:yes stop_codon:yes gene_type:complete
MMVNNCLDFSAAKIEFLGLLLDKKLMKWGKVLTMWTNGLETYFYLLKTTEQLFFKYK